MSGVALHKQNFRRVVERTGLVEGLGRMDADTGGRPAELFRFRREVLEAQPASGLSLSLLASRIEERRRSPPLSGEAMRSVSDLATAFSTGATGEIPSSFSCFSSTGAGACIIRSSPCWFSGKAMTSRMAVWPASSMTMRSMPGARPPWGGAP